MRRSFSVIVLVLAAGLVSFLGPLASAATTAPTAPAATAAPAGDFPESPDQFGVRLVDVPVSEANNPRGLRYIIDYLPTGTVIHRRILVINEEARTATFKVYTDAAQISDGLFTGDRGATHSELTNWMSLQDKTVTLPPGGSAYDMVTINVPEGATRGEHYGVVWVQQSSKAKNAKGFGLTEISRVGVRVYLAVGQGGAPPTSFKITSITAKRTAAGQPVITAHVANTGGRAVDLNGSVSLSDGPGGSSAGPFKARQIVTLAPGQAWDMTFAAPKSLPSGTWTAKVKLVSGITKVNSTATVTFGAKTAQTAAALAGLSSMQWVGLGLGVLVLILVLVMGRFAWHHRRRAAA